MVKILFWIVKGLVWLILFLNFIVWLFFKLIRLKSIVDWLKFNQAKLYLRSLTRQPLPKKKGHSNYFYISFKMRVLKFFQKKPRVELKFSYQKSLKKFRLRSIILNLLFLIGIYSAFISVTGGFIYYLCRARVIMTKESIVVGDLAAYFFKNKEILLSLSLLTTLCTHPLVKFGWLANKFRQFPIKLTEFDNDTWTKWFRFF